MMEEKRLILKEKGNCSCAYFKSPCTKTITIKKIVREDHTVLFELIQDSVRRNGVYGVCYCSQTYKTLDDLFKWHGYLKEYIDVTDDFYKEFINDKDKEEGSRP